MGPTQFTWVGLDPCDGFDWVEKIPSIQPNPCTSSIAIANFLRTIMLI